MNKYDLQSVILQKLFFLSNFLCCLSDDKTTSYRQLGTVPYLFHTSQTFNEYFCSMQVDAPNLVLFKISSIIHTSTFFSLQVPETIL